MTIPDLMPAFLRAEARRRRSQRAWSAGLLSAGAVAACLILTVQIGVAGPREAGAETERLRAEIEESEAQIKRLQAQLMGAGRREAVVRAALEYPDVAALLEILAVRAGERVVIERCEVAPVEAPRAGGRAPGRTSARRESARAAETARPFRVTVQGVSRSAADVGEFVRGLEDTGLFDGVALVESSQTMVQEVTLQRFSVALMLGGAAGAKGGGR